MQQSIETPLEIAQRLCPLITSERWQHTEALTPCEALLVHYSIQPMPILTRQHFFPQHVCHPNEKELLDYIATHYHGDRQKFVLSLDGEELWDQMQRALLSHSLILLAENIPLFYQLPMKLFLHQLKRSTMAARSISLALKDVLGMSLTTVMFPISQPGNFFDTPVCPGIASYY